MSDEGCVRTSRVEWAKRVERWRDSGLTAAQFGAETGVNPRTLAYWKWVLSKKSRGGKTAAPAISTPAFVEVRTAASSAAFELALGNGRRLQIPAAFDAGTLERLLAILER
jgi:hypothetical protein